MAIGDINAIYPNPVPQPALMSQGVNRTAQLPPQVQSDVAKMRNNGVPEDRINDYITNRMQYFATLPPAPAINSNATPQNLPAPALTTSAQASTLPVQGSAPPMPTVLPMRRPDNPNQLTADQFSTPAMNNTPPPALSNTNAPQSRGVLFSTPDQGRRSNTMLSVQRPDLGIGTNEMLMRVGGAGLANAGQGGLAAYGAMLDRYGSVQDQRRSNALAEYEADYRAQQDEQTRLDDLEKARLDAEAKAKGKTKDNAQQIGQIDQTIFDMDRALANLEGGMQLTGFFDATFGAAWDNITGNPEAAGRLLLQKLKVDDTLLRVAQTKGAISNKEMDLFMSPAPSKYADESVWIDWIKERKQAIQKVRSRLSGGEELDQSQQATQGQVNQFGQMGGGISLPAVGQSTNVGGVTVKRIS